MSSFFSSLGKSPISPAILGIALLVPAAIAQDFRGHAVPGERGNAYVAQNPAQATQQKPQYKVAERSTLVADRARQFLSKRDPNEYFPS